jgi:transposase-like protein
MGIIMKERHRYSEALKRRVVKEFEAGKISQAELTRRYGIRRGAVSDWLQVYGTIKHRNRVVEVVMSDQREKIEELQKALAEAHLKLRIYDAIIEEANEEYHTDIKKNFGTKALENLKTGSKAVLK